MATAEELWKLFGEVEHHEYGPTRTALTEQLLRHVDSAGDPRLSFLSRLIASNSFAYGGEPAKTFVTFSWCISEIDRNPQPYHERALPTLLWLYKSVVNGLTKFPEVPLERTHAVLDDMERRYREYGQGMHALYKYRYVVADHVGQHDEADRWFERWQSAPRDSLSDCIGCDPSDVADYLSSRGRYEEAVAVADPVLAGELSCVEQPQRILNELMVPYLLTGREQQAADAHRRSYRLERDALADMSDIAAHIAFCARTGNEHRGLEMVQRHVDWLDRAPSPSNEMDLAAAGGLLLRRVTELGHGDSPIRRRDQPETTAAALATELRERALALARRFDERNGTDRQSRRILERLDAEPFEVSLTLSPTARTAATTVAPPAPEPEPVPEISAEAGPAELIDLADKLYDDDLYQAMGTVLDRLTARFPTLDDPLLAGRRAVLVGERLRFDDSDQVLDTWAEAAELLAAAGATDRLSVLRARMALERAHAGETDDEQEPIRADIAYQEEHGDLKAQANSWERLSILHYLRQRPDEANEVGDHADKLAEQSGDQRLIAMHALLRARNRLAAERPEEAAAAARQAYEFFSANGPALRLAEAANICGHTTDDPDVQVELFGAVIAGPNRDAALPALVGRGHALMRLGRPVEAIPDLVEAVALCAEKGVDGGGAFARSELANAYRMAERPVEGAEVAEEALSMFERLGDTESANNTRYLLAGLYQALGDTAGAVTLYRELIAQLGDNPAGRGQIAEEAAGLLYDADRDGEAAEAFAIAASALHEAGDLIGELRALRREVGGLHYADEPERGEQVLTEIAERFATLPPELAAEPNAIFQWAMTGFEAGRLLMARDRAADAIAHLRGRPERLREIGADEPADRLEIMLDEALLYGGAPEEAEWRLRALLDRLPEDSPERESAADLHRAARDASTS